MTYFREYKFREKNLIVRDVMSSDKVTIEDDPQSGELSILVTGPGIMPFRANATVYSNTTNIEITVIRTTDPSYYKGIGLTQEAIQEAISDILISRQDTSCAQIALALAAEGIIEEHTVAAVAKNIESSNRRYEDCKVRIYEDDY